MKIFVKVSAKAKKNSIEATTLDHFKIYTSAPKEKGKANKAVVKLLALYFKVKPNHIFLLSGETSAYKIFEIKN
ncbi:DUF167 domain-containing protein [Candidatus Beckwithbacteria bacterium]|nr:DUF167 domain-containing protein [Candidatus Beckwithbacteria bacterium]